jgi:small subunit ribosomal protein S1
MDDGYWVSLLRDIEEELGVDAHDPEPDEFGGNNGVAGLAFHGGRWETGSIANDDEVWDRMEDRMAANEDVEVTISGYNRGGLLTEVEGLQGFVPASHLYGTSLPASPTERAAAFAARIGECLFVRIIEIDRSHCRLILSERLAREDGRGERLLATLEPGQVCHGTVTNLCPFGAFVDLGGFEGLIHISELSWGRVETAGDVLQPGDGVEVVVLQVQPEERKVALSRKRLTPDPWQGVEERYYAGQVLDAMITNVVDFGAFARLEAGLEGLIHISELAEGSFMHPRNVVNEGDQVRVRVLHVESSKRRIALTMRSTDPAVRSRPGIPSELGLTAASPRSD